MAAVRKPAALLAALAMSSVACVSRTQIRTDPSGAAVLVDGKYIGTTPVPYADASPMFSEKKIELKLEGYAPVRRAMTIKKDELDVTACLGGCLLIPLIWAYGYPASYTFKMRPLTPPVVLPKANPGDSPALTAYRRGTALYEQGEFKPAVREFLAAYALEPRASLLYNVALAYDRAYARKEAILHYERYLASTGDLPKRALAERRLQQLKAMQ